MLNLVFISIILGFMSTVLCNPLPQFQIDGGQNQRQEEQKYAIDRFTNRLVRNSRIRENYLNCFLDNGPCSPEANTIKPGMIPEAIKNECELCTEIQSKVIEKMMCFLNNHQPEILKQVAAKFDPNGEYMKQFINKLERNGNDQFLTSGLHQNQLQQNLNQPHLHQHQPQQNPNQPHQHEHQPQQTTTKSKPTTATSTPTTKKSKPTTSASTPTTTKSKPTTATSTSNTTKFKPNTATSTST
ncbi:putative odorant-binding protein A10 [Melanaphis sacchari]|uniref:putative odorant-binding protein A10 n=1 Tax=Melanaphis sacchari TaxID=742174 RepID=UPI000DC13EBD|nr:putative odorant-binding protein A10 [Melanaphis sacchari]